ncbi:MAG: hypothetical protein Q9160_008450 [Pyrenula sp. 1 TL-2023]
MSSTPPGTSRSDTPVPSHPEQCGFATIEPRLVHGTFVDFIAVPAIGGDPELTWTKRLQVDFAQPSPRLARSISNTGSATLVSSAASALLTPIAHGAFPKHSTTWPINDTSPIRLKFPEKEPNPLAWPTHELRLADSRARVLLYDHGKPRETDDLFELARRLLKKLMEDDGRKQKEKSRPLFFLCHSTGGLVAKAAIAIAADSEEYGNIASQCFGLTFFATPHRGSSYLASAEFSESIFDVMNLRWQVPSKLRKSLSVNHQDQLRIANLFRPISTELKIFSFFEAVDTELLIHSPSSSIETAAPFRAPITSIRSAILDLENEHEIPLQTDHTGTAAFEGDEEPLQTHLQDLKAVINDAIKFSNASNYELDVDENVHVEINGFFEDPSLGVSEVSPLTMWSSRKSLNEFLKIGPRKSLQARLQEPASQDARGRRGSVIGIARERSNHTDTIPDRPPSRRSAQHVDQVPQLQSRPSIQSDADLGVTDRPRGNGVEQPSPSVRIQREASFPSEISGDSDPQFLRAPSPKRRLSAVQSASDPAELSRHLGSISRSLAPEMAAEARPHSNVHLKSSLDVPRVNQGLQSLGELADKPFVLTPSKKADTSSHKFSWIHVPFNHTGWVAPILKTVSEDGARNSHLNLLHEDNWSDKHVKGRHAAPHARFVKPLCIHSTIEAQRQRGVRRPSPTQLALYLPYLHWDSYRQLLERRQLISKRMKQGRVRPVPEEVSKSKSLEAKVVWQYLGSEPPLHCRRTLDQFGYPNLRNTRARDDDQILYKRTKERAGTSPRKSKPPKQTKKGEKLTQESPVADGKVLMVDQLWLWMIDQKSVVTLFPRKESSVAEGRLYRQGDLRDSIYNEINGDLSRHCENCMDFAALVVLHAVTVLFERTQHRDLQVLRIFEESISILTEKMTQSFKAFRTQGFQNKTGDYDRNEYGQVLTLEEKMERDKKIEEQNKRDLSALLELRDIDDELSTIGKLLAQQRETVVQMLEHYRSVEQFKQSPSGLEYLKQALDHIYEYEKQIDEMRGNANLANQSFKDLLDIKQKQANVDEARMARWQADVSQNQSRSIMIFTVITIIFLPLTFFTGLFGMNIRQWSGVATNPNFHTVFTYAIPITVAIILTALFVAFNDSIREYAIILKKIATGIALDAVATTFKILGVRWAAHKVRSKHQLGEECGGG